MTQNASVLVTPRMQGAWEDCNKEGCDNTFFRHVYGDRRYSLSDKIGVCPLCIFEIKVINDTLPKRMGNVGNFIHHKSTDAKPGQDTL